jgi:adenine phosphoribosyltransferase
LSPAASPENEALSLLRRSIRDVPDFPKPGILFKDITPLLGDARAFGTAIELLAARVRARGADCVVGIESRGFIFGAPVARELGIGFVPLRKPGKLPYKKVSEKYQLEYGEDAIEMHEDAVAGRSLVIVDDLLATGGTAGAAARLCERHGARVLGCAFLIELAFLGGRKRLDQLPVDAILEYA